MYEDENPLERALRLAATDPAFGLEFYGTLIGSEIFILGTKDAHPGEKVVDLVARAGSNIHIQEAAMPDGSTTIPFFSSIAALQLYIEGEERYLRMTAQDFFELTRGEHLFLNPASDYAKSFTAEEIEGLLRDGLPTQHSREVTKEETRVLLGAPATPPTEIMDTLSRLFEKDARVRTAFMAMIQFPDREDHPNLCVGVECDQVHYDDICPAASVAVTHLISKNRVILFFHVDPQNLEGPAAYMVEEVAPFYCAKPPKTPSLDQSGRRRAPLFGRRGR